MEANLLCAATRPRPRQGRDGWRWQRTHRLAPPHAATCKAAATKRRAAKEECEGDSGKWERNEGVLLTRRSLRRSDEGGEKTGTVVGVAWAGGLRAGKDNTFSDLQHPGVTAAGAVWVSASLVSSLMLAGCCK